MDPTFDKCYMTSMHALCGGKMDLVDPPLIHIRGEWRDS